eukprot:6182112-Pleurochrysis_carterae.AAC.1
MSMTQLLFDYTVHVFDGSVDATGGEKAEASVTRFSNYVLPNLPPRTLDRVILAGHRNKAQFVVENDGADAFDGQSDTTGSLDAHVGVALRYAVGGKEAAIAACRACRAAVNECSSRAADSARRISRRVGRRTGRCRRDLHRVCGLEKKKQHDKEGRASRSDNRAETLHNGDPQQRLRRCDGLEDGWVSAHVDLFAAVVSQCSICACRRRNHAEEVRLSVVRGRSTDVVDVSALRVHLIILVRRIGGVVVVVAVVGLGKDVKGRVEAE